MEPGDIMLHSQGLANNAYPEPHQPNSSYIYKIALPATTRFS